MPKCCKNFFELLASHLPFRVMLQMSNAVPEETEVSWGRNISLAPSLGEPNWKGKIQAAVYQVK